MSLQRIPRRKDAPNVRARSRFRRAAAPSARRRYRRKLFSGGHHRPSEGIDMLHAAEETLPRQLPLAKIAAFAERLEILYDGLSAQCNRPDVIRVENDS